MDPIMLNLENLAIYSTRIIHVNYNTFDSNKLEILTTSAWQTPQTLISG